MRPLIEALDVDAMEWSPLGRPGLFTKLLSRDSETGARTALQRMVPGGEFAPPSVAHFHTTYEEILGISGLFSFDSRTWITQGSYVFHPPRTVHGFKSAVPTESWFLSRVGRDLDVTLVHEPDGDDLYVIEGPAPSRVPVAKADPAGELGWTSGVLLGGEIAVEWCVLSVDPESGEGSALLRIPAGWASATRSLDHYVEMFVVEGQVGIAPAPVAAEPRLTYFFYPPEAPIGALQALAPSLVYLNFGKSMIA